MILLFLGMVILLGFTIASKFNDEIQEHDTITQDGKDASATLTGYYPGVIDNMFLFFAVGIGIVSLIFAALVKVHPIFIPLYFIGLTITIFLSGLFSNIYQEMASNPNLVVYSSQLTFTTSVLTYLPIIITVFGILLMVIMYKLNSNE